MSLRFRKNVTAFAIFAVLIGGGFATYKHSDQAKRMAKSAISTIKKRIGSGTSSDASASETDSDTDGNAQDSDRDSALAESGLEEEKKNESDDEQGGGGSDQESQSDSSASSSKDQDSTSDDKDQEKDQTSDADSSGEEGSSETEKDTEEQTGGKSEADKNPVRFDLSPYPNPVRRRIRRAQSIYKRAQKHYSYVTNDDLSIQRRKAQNQKARELYQKTMTVLDEIRQKAGTDKNIDEFFEHASEMYGKCYRRAKMWGAY